MRELIIDISANQGGRIDWEKFGLQNPRLVAVRATISWGYRDKWFNLFWKSLAGYKIPRCAYHVVYPGESPVRQIDNLFGQLGNDLGEKPPVLDLELDHAQSPATIIRNVEVQAALIEKRTGKLPLMYSRAQWLNVYMPNWKAINDFEWWLALYRDNRAIEHPGPVKPAKGMNAERIIIHQTADKFPSIDFGVNQLDAKCIDMNRWVGVRSIDDWLGTTGGGQQQQEQQQRYRVISFVGAKVRKAPSILAAQVGSLPFGSMFLSSEFSFSDGYWWARIGAGWVALGSWIVKL